MATATRAKTQWIRDKQLMPELGSKSIIDITSGDALRVVEKIPPRGKIESAHRAKQRLGEVIRWAIVNKQLPARDPTAELRGVLPPSAPRESRQHHGSKAHPRVAEGD